ncbi:response regulator [Desulfobacterales bacterium HSG16]|nr:response regulator [Desulfobacterales bacterium HSG16]
MARKMLTKSILKNYEESTFEIFTAVDGLDGVEKYKEINPDVTFLDLTMPVMNGYESLAEMKKIDKDAVIIITTADIQAKSVSNVMALGAFTVLQKPSKADSVKDNLIKAGQKLARIEKGKTEVGD